MSDYKIFILIFLEVGSYMLLWNMFNKKHEKTLYKSILIVFFTSLVVLITNYIYPPFQFFANYLFLFLAIKITFKKSMKYLLLEFGLIMAIFGIIQLALIITLTLSIPYSMVKDDFIYLLVTNLICMLLSLYMYKYVSCEKLKIFF